MNISMPREQRERYAKAVLYAVVERDLQFAAADDFADWWTSVGWLTNRDDVDAGFAQWTSKSVPGAEGDEDDPRP